MPQEPDLAKLKESVVALGKSEPGVVILSHLARAGAKIQDLAGPLVDKMQGALKSVTAPKPAPKGDIRLPKGPLVRRRIKTVSLSKRK